VGAAPPAEDDGGCATARGGPRWPPLAVALTALGAGFAARRRRRRPGSALSAPPR
jgi:MYXO-CTERM domain-containing protein